MPAYRKFDPVPYLERAAFGAIVEGYKSDADWLDVVAPDWRSSVYVKQLQARIDAAAARQVGKKPKKSKRASVRGKRSFP